MSRPVAERENLSSGFDQNLATFVTTWMGPDVTDLIASNLHLSASGVHTATGY